MSSVFCLVVVVNGFRVHNNFSGFVGLVGFCVLDLFWFEGWLCKLSQVAVGCCVLQVVVVVVAYCCWLLSLPL